MLRYFQYYLLRSRWNEQVSAYFKVIYVYCVLIATTGYREGATFIYPILDWSKPGMTTLICVLVTLFIILLHCLSYGAYYLRKSVHARLIIKDKETKKEPNDKEAYNNPVLSCDVV